MLPSGSWAHRTAALRLSNAVIIGCLDLTGWRCRFRFALMDANSMPRPV